MSVRFWTDWGDPAGSWRDVLADEAALLVGLILLLDRDRGNVPELADAVVSGSRSGLAVKVLHAADVDLSEYGADEVVPAAQVEVEIHIGEGAPGSLVFEGIIDVPSGWSR